MSVTDVEERHVQVLHENRDAIRALGTEYGISDIRVFEGSEPTTLFAKVSPDRSYFDVGAFLEYAEDIVRFPLDLLTDRGASTHLGNRQMVALGA